MKKVTVQFYGYAHELNIAEISQEKHDACLDGQEDASSIFFEESCGDTISGWDQIDSVMVYVDDECVFEEDNFMPDEFDFCDYECIPPKWVLPAGTQFMDKKLKDLVREIEKVEKEIEEHAPMDEDEKCEYWTDKGYLIFSNVFGNNSVYSYLKIGAPVIMEEVDGEKMAAAYEFEIPDDEDFDIAKLKVVEEDSGSIPSYGFQALFSHVFYGNSIVPVTDFDAGDAELSYHVGTIAKDLNLKRIEFEG